MPCPYGVPWECHGTGTACRARTLVFAIPVFAIPVAVIAVSVIAASVIVAAAIPASAGMTRSPI